MSLKKRTTSLFFLIAIIFTLSFPALTFANTFPTINRLAGNTRYDTSSAIAKQGWIQSDYAVLAYGENYPDALSSAPLAKKYNAPILLTTSNSLPNTTKQTLINLQVKNVIIIGGTGVISSSIDSELQSMGITPTRIFGQDKYDTAIKVAEQISTPSTLFVCTGEDYSDALSVAPIAAMKQMPIILVPNDYIPDSVKNYIASVNISKTYIIGNTDIISNNIVNQFPNSERILGSNKYDRNINILNKFNSDLTGNNVYIATGNNFADALAGTSLAAKTDSLIVLVDNYLYTSTQNYLSKNLSNKQLNILGGTAVVSDSLLQNYTNTTTSTLTPSQISKSVSPSVLYIEVYDSTGNAYGNGSGFIVDNNGKIVTNYHVIEEASSAKVYLSDGKIYDVNKVFAYDKDRDVAVLGINASGLSAVSLGDSNLINTGDKIYTIGSPKGLENTLSDGLISSNSRTINGQKYIQISAPISPGSSGGVLVDEQSKVIGVTSAGLQDSQNLNFAIPINDIKPFLTQDINKTLADLISTHTIPSSDTSVPTKLTDLQSYLNNNFPTLYINEKKMNFYWEVNKIMVGNTDIQIHAYIEPSNYGDWLLLCLNGHQDSLTNGFSAVFNQIQTAFPNKSIWLDGIYEDLIDSYPTGYKSSEVYYNSTREKWHIIHEIISFFDEDGKGGEDPFIKYPN